MERLGGNWTLSAIKQAASVSSGTGNFLDVFSIHLLVSTYTKVSVITKDEVFNRCVIILYAVGGIRPYTVIIER